MVTRGFTGRRPSPDTVSRIPPGQHEVFDFPVLSAGPTPRVDLRTWMFTLLHSARTWNDVIFREELLRHETLQQDIQLRFAITRGSLSDGTAARGADYVRRVDDAMLHDVVRAMPAPPALCFVCGNNGFVGTVADSLVAIGIDPLHIRTERYGE